ncbi:magnesium transporter [Granulicatella balaenopterae]|uniref:Magnesium transporter MgtE n=1 Tax=Granulicatella balaenopterae TaxID=137733 RepID=A0A1H9MLX1_9LACT|nr:magnesium transporter [Granulicatella balaenopterae]SER24696.1 magnesium transporter [Granulicatella balaenopterae]
MADNTNYEFDEILEQIQHTIATDDREQFLEIFLNNHTYDQAQLYLELTPEERQVVYHFLSPMDMATVFELIEEDVEDVEKYLLEMNERYAAKMFAAMYADNAVDVLQEIKEDEAKKYLKLMPRKTSTELMELLNYEDSTAGALMTTEIVAIHELQTVGDAMMMVKQMAEEAETVYYVYVVDEENRLQGVITLRDLILQPDRTLVKDIMQERLVKVHVYDDQAEVAQIIRDYDFLALPVVDEDEVLLGIITVDDAIDVIDEEATSDYSGLAGVNVDSQSTNPLISASKRLPWLITLLFLGMSTSTLLSRYEEIIANASILSIFVTLITGTAGNAGTQSLAVAVRKLGTHEEEDSYLKLLIHEVLTGLISGLVTGLTISIVVGIWQHNWILGMIIGLAMFCAITVATIAGSFIPLVMDKIGVDPAVASGPFISTLSDLTSVLIYFTIAKHFLEAFMN